MGRKDAQQNRGTTADQYHKKTPVDQYRKIIGKQQSKVGKKDLQAVKDRKDAKESAMGVKEVVLMLTAFSIVIGAVYLFLYVYLTKDSGFTKTEP